LFITQSSTLLSHDSRLTTHETLFTLHSSLFTQYPTRFACGNILPDIQPKGHEEVDHEGRSKSDEGQVNKIQPDTGRIDLHPLPYLLTNAEGGFFKEVPLGIEEVFYVI